MPRPIQNAFNSAKPARKANPVGCRPLKNDTGIFSVNVLRENLPQDVQMHILYTEGVGWTIVFIDKILGTVRGITQEAHPQLVLAAADAIQNADLNSNKTKT